MGAGGGDGVFQGQACSLTARQRDKLTLHNVWLVICAKHDLSAQSTSVCVCRSVTLLECVFTISIGSCLKSKHLSTRIAVAELQT